MVNRNDPGIAASVVLCPDTALGSKTFSDDVGDCNLLGNEGSLSENSEQDGEIQGCAPDPEARVLAVVREQVVVEDEQGEREQNLRCVSIGARIAIKPCRRLTIE